MDADLSLDFDACAALQRQGRFLEAARGFAAVIAAEPGHVPALIHLGVLRLHQTRLSEAEALLRQAITLAPESAAARANLGLVLQAAGRIAEAIEAHESAVRTEPDAAEFRFGLASALMAAGRHQDALATYESLPASFPQQADAAQGIAAALYGLNRYQEALAQYDRALALDPGFAEASHGKATTLQRLGRQQEAVACFEQALAIDPGYAEAHHGIGISLLALERYENALNHLDRGIAAGAGSADVHYRRGNALTSLGRPRLAEAAYRRCLEIAPGMVRAMLGLGAVLRRLGRYAEAVESYEQALALHPANPGVLAGLADVLPLLHSHAEALVRLEQALELAPRSPVLQSRLGVLRERMGDPDGARAAFAEAVRLAPRRPALYHALFNAGPVTPDDPRIVALQALDGAALSPQDRIIRLFALAKAYDDTGEHTRGFACLVEANALKRASITYDEARVTQQRQHVQGRIAQAEIRAGSGRGDPSRIPIFILGMPCSGIALTERLLAGHEQVCAGGERRDFERVVQGMRRPASVTHVGPTIIGGTAFDRIGRTYVERLPPLPPGKTRMTETISGADRLVGLIHLSLPYAKIIDVRRNAVDTCLLCFARLFEQGKGYAYDLAELGRYYRAYEDMMARWRQVLPPHAILDVEYDAMVNDPVGQTWRLLDFCGLARDGAAATRGSDVATGVPAAGAASLPLSPKPWRPDSETLRPLLDGLGIPDA